ncbi:MAG: hypothetical protein ITG07_10750 [Candidimonas sp.]|nr:hypothetical protein [Candidimonas sp.]
MPASRDANRGPASRAARRVGGQLPVPRAPAVCAVQSVCTAAEHQREGQPTQRCGYIERPGYPMVTTQQA